jgi:tetratricopeptide (TPR) repeat protein
MVAWVSWNRLRAGEAAEAWQRSIESARLAGDERAEAQSLAQFLAASLFGPFPVDEGIRLCERILAERDERDRATPSALRALGGFKGMAGSFDEARRFLERDRALVNELGLPIALVSSAEVSGLVEMLAGDPAAAERWYRWAFEYLEQMGEHSGLAVFAADVAQALCGQGRYEEALDFTQVGESGLVGDLQTRIQLDSTAAKAMAKLGRLDEAECLGRESVALVAQTDLTNIHADALCDFAEVLRLAGKEGEASSAVEQAARLYEQRGNVVAAGRARELLAGSRR